MLASGVQIGGSKIVRVLGVGNVATVYEVVHNGQRRALKVVELAAPSSKARERLAQEGEAISMIEHVNVVR